MAVARKICDEVVAIDDAAVEGQPAPRAETAAKQVIDLWNDRRRQNQAIGFALDQRPCLRVPPIAAVVIRVDDAGIEQDAHVRFFVRRLFFRVLRGGSSESPPKPLSARTSSTRSAVSVCPLANAPAPGGAASRRARDVGVYSFPNDFRHRPLLTQHLQFEEDFQLRFEVDGRPFHYVYVSIPFRRLSPTCVSGLPTICVSSARNIVRDDHYRVLAKIGEGTLSFPIARRASRSSADSALVAGR